MRAVEEHVTTQRATLSYEDRDAFREVCGPNDDHLKLVEELLGVSVDSRGNTVSITGEQRDVEFARAALDQFYELAKRGYNVSPADIPRAVQIISQGSGTRLSDVFLDTLNVPTAKRKIAPKNLNQKRYVDAIRNHTLTFGVGAAGTGKTYLAMAMAVQALLARDIKRIILTRPAVEAGEKLGFLPGDMAEKVNPYLRPLYDALYDMLDLGRVTKLMQENAIEVAPLAFMRGRTLNDAFVILDEAQNATREQMRMFLTRLGFNTKTIVTGDVTQTDLPDRDRSGLAHAVKLLREVRGVAVVEFQPEDVVRHPLVQRIIVAYADDDVREAEARATRDDVRRRFRGGE
ncbi:MAG: PhoH family protein [Deltaproteobacteria bacterium]|jgi:phosphate starvation-inducible PhoH-like protein|nr:PhoH family protein [Deltaproteobacteria bacterium]